MLKFAEATVLLAATLVLGSVPAESNSTRETLQLDRNIQAAVTQVSSRHVSETIHRLVSFETRNTCSDWKGTTGGISAARDWLKGQYESLPGMRMHVVLDPFQATKCTKPVEASNVVAWIPGTTSPNRLIVLGGHYDSRNDDVLDIARPAPGANDSGSQTALVLEVARALAGKSFGSTLVFVAFAGEEQGVLGSSAFIQHLPTLFPGAHVEAMLNSDIVGGDNTANDSDSYSAYRLYSPGIPSESSQMPDGSTDATSPSRVLMHSIADLSRAYFPEFAVHSVLREDRDGRGSDHLAFTYQGMAGVRFIEMNENTDHQHEPQDLEAYVNPEYTAKLARVQVAVAASLARAPDSPAALTAGKTSPGVVSLSWSAPAATFDHYVVAARTSGENLYRRRVRVSAEAHSVELRQLADLGLGLNELTPGEGYYVSIAAVDREGHESLFAPEWRCNAQGCKAPQGK